MSNHPNFTDEQCSVLSPSTDEIKETYFVPEDKERVFKSSWVKIVEENEEEGYMFSINPSIMEMQGSQDFEFKNKITSIVRIGAA